MQDEWAFAAAGEIIDLCHRHNEYYFSVIIHEYTRTFYCMKCKKIPPDTILMQAKLLPVYKGFIWSVYDKDLKLVEGVGKNSIYA